MHIWFVRRVLRNVLGQHGPRGLVVGPSPRDGPAGPHLRATVAGPARGAARLTQLCSNVAYGQSVIVVVTVVTVSKVRHQRDWQWPRPQGLTAYPSQSQMRVDRPVAAAAAVARHGDPAATVTHDRVTARLARGPGTDMPVTYHVPLTLMGNLKPDSECCL